MKFLADEDFPAQSVRLLRQAGYDVLSIAEVSPGVSDEKVLQQARDEDRVLLTFDRDYGELLYRLKVPPPRGVVYFRPAPKTPQQPAQQLIQLLRQGNIQLEGYFTVIEVDRIRQRPIQH